MPCVRWLIEELDASFGIALHNACISGNLECVKYLVQRGADINYVGYRGQFYSPLDTANLHDHVVHYLLSLRPIILPSLRNRTLALCVERDWEDVCVKSICLIMQSGTRLPQKEINHPSSAMIIYRLQEYQTFLDDRHRQCVRAAVMLMLVLKEKGVPRDLRKQICNKYVTPTWLDDEWGDKFKMKNVVL
jgi:hypothetical protein